MKKVEQVGMIAVGIVHYLVLVKIGDNYYLVHMRKDDLLGGLIDFPSELLSSFFALEFMQRSGQIYFKIDPVTELFEKLAMIQAARGERKKEQ